MGISRPPTLLALTSYVAGHVAHLGRQGLVAELDSHGLRPPHYATLAALHDFGPLPQFDLAARLGFNRSHLVGYLDTLQERDLVERERDARDRRVQHITLTGEGRALCDRLNQAARRSQDTLLEVLDDADRATLHDLLSRVLAAHEDQRE